MLQAGEITQTNSPEIKDAPSERQLKTLKDDKIVNKFWTEWTEEKEPLESDH